MISSLEQTITQAREKVSQLTDVDEGDQKLLNGLLIHAPTAKGKLNIAQHILQAGDLKELANHYYTAMLIPVRAGGGKIPLQSCNTSHLSNSPNGGTHSNPERAIRDPSALKICALLRDDDRCMVTGRLDWGIFERRSGFVQPAGTSIDVTQASHIMPMSLNDMKNERELEARRVLWTALETFAGISLADFKGDKMNSTENICTFSTLVHARFGALSLALEPIPGQLNTYKVLDIRPEGMLMSLPEQVTFVDHSPQQDIPLPSPVYLGLHAALCKVLRASGRDGEIDDFLEALEQTPVLAEDGSTAKLLELAIMRAIPISEAGFPESETVPVTSQRF